MNRYLVPLFAKIGSQRHMVVLRESFLSVISIILVGSLFLIPTNLPGLSDILAPYAAYMNIPYQATFGILAIYLSMLIAYNLAGSYDLDRVSVSITSMMAFLVSILELANIGGVDYISIQWFGAWGIFGAIVIGFFTAEVFHFCEKHGIYFKAPAGVPPGVARFIKATLPQLIVITPLWLLTIAGIKVPTLISDAMRPLISLADTLPAFLIAKFIENLTWYVGVHSWSAIGPAYFPFLVSNEIANAEAVAKGLEPPYIATFNTYFGMVAGGTGSHFPLVLFALKSKSKTLRTVARAGFLPVLLNINEPVLFGFPIILNPIYFIPHVILQPLICGSLAYLVTAWGWVSKCYIMFFAFVPCPFLWYFANLDPRALFWGAFLGYVVAGVIYYPFYKIHEKFMIEREAQEAQEAEAEE